MLDVEALHGEVLRVAGGKPCTYTNGGGSDQAIRLTERDALTRVLSAPTPGAHPLLAPEWSHAHACEEAQYELLLMVACATQHLLYVDRADPRHVSLLAQAAHTLYGWATAQRIDQYRRVQQQLQAC